MPISGYLQNISYTIEPSNIVKLNLSILVNVTNNESMDNNMIGQYISVITYDSNIPIYDQEILNIIPKQNKPNLEKNILGKSKIQETEKIVNNSISFLKVHDE